MNISQNHNKRKMSDGIRPAQKKRSVYTSHKRSTHSFSVVDTTSHELAQAINTKKRKIKKTFQIQKRQKRTHGTSSNQLNIFSFIRRHKKLLKWSFLTAVYIVILFIVFSKLEKTSIALTPKVAHIKETTQLTAFINPNYKQLGVHIISLKDELHKKVEAKEEQKVEEKARGTITIFNNYSTEPQRLSPHTRFKSVSGKIFLLGDQTIEIPGKHNGKAGSVQAMVYAEKAGPEYNIDVTDFSIPGFKEAGLDNKYQNIYALSLKKFSGGFRGTKLVVGEEQKKKTIKELEAQLKEQLSKKLLAEKTDRVLLVQDSIQLEYQKPIIEKNVIKEKAQIFALLIEKKQLEKFLKRKYLPKVLEKDIFLQNFDGIEFRYTGKQNLDFEKLKKIQLSANINTRFVWNIDKELVKESLVGVSKKDVPIILREFEEIQKAEIQIFPFWQKHISDNKEHISVEVL